MKRYVNNAKMATPNLESRTVGIQNKNVFQSVFSIRLVARNNAKNKTPRTRDTEAKSESLVMSLRK